MHFLSRRIRERAVIAVALVSLAGASAACTGEIDGAGDEPARAARQTPSDESFAPASRTLEGEEGERPGAEEPEQVEQTKPGKTEPEPTPTAPAATTEYAPYFYSWGWDNPLYPFTTLVDMAAKTGTTAATLGFVTAPGGACATSRAIPNHKSDVAAFRALGGHLKVSFGGASGTYLENGCTTIASLSTALGAFVDETGLTDLDFDVEQAVAMNATVNARRSAALAAVQKAKGIKISFTLPANPPSSTARGGMTAAAYAVVRSALDAGVVISHVNLMTMDYGTSFSAGRKMGDLAISTLTAAASQLRELLPALSEAEVYGTLGATPMIGHNDVPTEIFTLDDARTLIAFAKAKKLGLVSLWAIQRDVPCAGALDLVLCSGAQTAKYQFNEIFRSAS